MASIRIVTDSTADIPKEIREQYHIRIVPLKVHIDQETYLDSITIEAEQFYEKLQMAQALPTTSQPSPSDFIEVYRSILAEEEDVQIISIHLSSAFSGTYQSAVLASNMLEMDERITIIDSKSASYGFGMLVVAAAKAAQKGMEKDSIVKLVHELYEQRELYFLVDTLEYLQKGGRIGKAAAMIGSLLNIRPILTIDSDGEVTSIDKVRGQKRAMLRIIDFLRKPFEGQEIMLIFAVTNETENAERFTALAQEHFTIRSTQYIRIGPVIGTHVGPGTIGVFACPVSYAEYL